MNENSNRHLSAPAATITEPKLRYPSDPGLYITTYLLLGAAAFWLFGPFIQFAIDDFLRFDYPVFWNWCWPTGLLCFAISLCWIKGEYNMLAAQVGIWLVITLPCWLIGNYVRSLFVFVNFT